MTTLGERVKAERRARGWTQVELAQRVTRAGYRISQGGIAQIERRGETEPKSIVQLAQALGVSVHWLQSDRGEKTPDGMPGEPTAVAGAGPFRRRMGGEPAPVPAAPLQVYSSAEGGSEGALILSNEPVAWVPRDTRLEGIREAYGCFVSGDSMEPAYERGNLLLVNPTVAPGPGDDCLFLRETADGTRLALVKRLLRRNTNSWSVQQFNPPSTYTLQRKDWQKAHVVIGKYNRWT